MKKEQCFHLGHVSKTQGFKGGLIVFLDVDIPEEYSKLESVFIEIDKALVPFFERYQLKQKGYAAAKFEGIDTEEDALRLKGKQMYLPEEQLPKLTGNQFYYHEVIGFEVVDASHGSIGAVYKVYDNPGNPLLATKHKGKEVLVPISDLVIQKVDRVAKCIEVTAPEGLIDLYLDDPENDEL